MNSKCWPLSDQTVKVNQEFLFEGTPFCSSVLFLKGGDKRTTTLNNPLKHNQKQLAEPPCVPFGSWISSFLSAPAYCLKTSDTFRSSVPEGQLRDDPSRADPGDGVGWQPQGG